ncbi:hypothetical protein SAMN05428989_3026 [Pseudoxanthomonas sp. GM95]|uniref:hypothetical protein n=1 Tax=Pseudoxanthomonas sp. GM95 TaxID=1881043 RepID=UPI0008B76620|nr:hypothetical protein [Pseudoxanthomonas sp. GM95]SEM09261.1 hypothetical protein SAMN05428989_3026 [Pseudoxanthomonas sp. GM95]
MNYEPDDNDRSILIDIDREREYWRQHYERMPRASQHRSFELYWPALSSAYDVYLNHPHTDEDTGSALYANSQAVRSRGMTLDEARTIYAEVWQRIKG